MTIQGADAWKGTRGRSVHTNTHGVDNFGSPLQEARSKHTEVWVGVPVEGMSSLWHDSIETFRDTLF